MAVLIVTTVEDEIFDGVETIDLSDGTGLSLREAIGIASSDPTVAYTIKFSENLKDRALVLENGQLTITTSMTIDGDINGDRDFDITIDGDNKSRIIEIVQPSQVDPYQSPDIGLDVSLSGLRLTNGRTVGEMGVAVAVTSNFNNWLSSAVPEVLLLDLVIENNTAEGYLPRSNEKLAVVSAFSSQLSGDNVKIVDNDGTGVFLEDYADAIFASSDISRNSGDGVHASFYAGVQINGSIVSGNLASGVRVFNESSGLVQDSIISENKEGGLHVEFLSRLIVDNALVNGNSSESGAGIYVGYRGDLFLYSSRVSNNSAAEYGGGIFIRNGVARFNDNIVENNVAQFGGGIFVASSYQFGSGYSRIREKAVDKSEFFYSEGAPVGTVVRGNTAWSSGGGIATAYQGELADGSSANIVLELFGTNVYNNIAHENGAGFFISDSTRASLVNTSIFGNNASGSGGGVFLEGGNLNVKNASITGNVSEQLAGGLSLVGGESKIYNSIIAGNVSSGEPSNLELSAESDLRANLILSSATGVFENTKTIGNGVVAGQAEVDANGVATLALLGRRSNPALDKALDAFAPAVDAKGLERVDLFGVGNNGVNTGDLGAFELQALQQQPNALLVRAGGTGTQAAPPRFEVLVDGVLLGARAVTAPVSSFNVNNDALYQDYAFTFNGAAPVRVDIRYFNDGNSGGINRNLFVDYIELNGQRFESEVAGFFNPNNNVFSLGGRRESLFVNGTLVFDDLPEIPTGTNRLPSIVPINDVIITEGSIASFTVSASDPDGDPVTLSARVTRDDSGQVVNSSEYVFRDNGNGRGIFSWATDSSDDGAYTVEVIASDGKATTTEEVSLLVEDVAEVNTLLVRAGGNGTLSAPPRFEVLVDGVSLGAFAITAPIAASGFNTKNDANFEDFVFEFAGSAPNDIAIRYFGDGTSGGVNRNLFVDYIEINGVTLESEQDGFFTPNNGNSSLGGPRESLFVNGTLLFEDVLL